MQPLFFDFSNLIAGITVWEFFLYLGRYNNYCFKSLNL